jgi:replicative DNA helicase
MHTELPFYIQKAVDLGLLQVDAGKIVSFDDKTPSKAMEVARIVDKLQPTSVQEREDTTPQEAIVLSKVLTSPSGVARERWAELRGAFGVGHGQGVPMTLWSDMRFRAIAHEIDLTFIGQTNNQLISRDSLVAGYSMRGDSSRIVTVLDFNQAIFELSDPELMEDYGDAASEWSTALDVLKQFRVRSLYLETLHVAKQNIKADAKLEEALEFLQKRAMEGVAMIRGTIGSQGHAVDAVDSIIGTPQGNRQNWIDRLNSLEQAEKPVSTGFPSIDLDIGGGVSKPKINSPVGGRMFTFAARTSTGKTACAAHVATSLVAGGLTVGFISAELDSNAIEARLFSSLSRKVFGLQGYHWTATQDKLGYITVMELQNPLQEKRHGIANLLGHLAGAIQDIGGRLLVEAPWGACVDAAINSMRSMKARHPELRAVVLDHFHSLTRHKGAPMGDASMLEERAYKLMGAAKELGIDLFVMAQMNQVGIKAEATNKSDSPPPPPTQDQIRGTDALSHVSHAVWLVRRQKQMSGEPSSQKIEVWHSKTREGQVFWESSGFDDHLTMVRDGQIEKSIIQIDYSTCTLKTDDTLQHPLILKSRKYEP